MRGIGDEIRRDERVCLESIALGDSEAAMRGEQQAVGIGAPIRYLRMRFRILLAFVHEQPNTSTFGGNQLGVAFQLFPDAERCVHRIDDLPTVRLEAYANADDRQLDPKRQLRVPKQRVARRIELYVVPRAHRFTCDCSTCR